MSPRPRKVTDEEVLEATERVMGRVGPGELSLGAIGAEAGLTAGALVQRFGSKRDLLLALVERWSGRTGEMLREVRAARASPMEAMRHYVECVAAMGESPEAMARHLAYLQLDLADAEFRRRMRASAEATRDALAAWLEEAKSTGELSPEAPVEPLARLIETMIGGSLLSWAVYQEGTAVAWVLRDLDTVLAPHRGRSAGTRE